jgi:hypothetical protein
MHPITFLALDLAAERTREVEFHRRVMLAQSKRPVRQSWPRRSLASAFAIVSRGSAAAARRLDSVVGDDLGRTLASTK